MSPKEKEARVKGKHEGAFPHRNLEEFSHFINERHAIKLRKESGAPRPWTRDPFLGEFRFCNVNREDDRVTRWLAKNWRKPHAKDPDLWFALTVFRRGFNNTPA
jgi:5-hmdU DNA kinase-like protein